MNTADTTAAIYFKTPTGEHFFQYFAAVPSAVSGVPSAERVKLVTLRAEAPAVEMLRYEPGMFWAWGCIPATEAEFKAALGQALEGLSTEPKSGKQLDLFPVRRLDSTERKAS